MDMVLKSKPDAASRRDLSQVANSHLLPNPIPDNDLAYVRKKWRNIKICKGLAFNPSLIHIKTLVTFHQTV